MLSIAAPYPDLINKSKEKKYGKIRNMKNQSVCSSRNQRR
jgi:hypothetical protein